jgi:ATP-dependent helicase/nuclease subunit A
MAALQRTEAGELFRLGGKPEQTQPGKYPWQIRVREAQGAEIVVTAEEKAARGLPEQQLAQLKQGITFRYPHLAATAAPSKQTATQRKGREKDAEVSENAPEGLPGSRTWRRAMFGKTGTSATEMGTATHTVMQYLDFENCGDEAAVEAQVRLLAKMGTLTPEQAQMVNCGWIARFFETELGKKLCGPGQLLREFKFSILDDGENYDPALVEEKILLQGVVDCALVEPDGITVVDFKTDYVTEDTVAARTEHYRPQVLAYADALRRIYGLPIKAAYLYFFRLGATVNV